MSNYNALTTELLKFANDRDWGQFHNNKDLAIALNIEAGELLEQFLWKSAAEANEDDVKDELADVIAYALLLANKYNFNIEKIVMDKIAKNTIKYPVELSKGNSTKYNQRDK